LCWGIIKNYAKHNDFTLSNLKTQLEEGFNQVKSSTSVKIIRKIREKEDEFWNGDMLFDPSE